MVHPRVILIFIDNWLDVDNLHLSHVQIFLHVYNLFSKILSLVLLPYWTGF